MPEDEVLEEGELPSALQVHAVGGSVALPSTATAGSTTTASTKPETRHGHGTAILAPASPSRTAGASMGSPTSVAEHLLRERDATIARMRADFDKLKVCVDRLWSVYLLASCGGVE